jgi:hypothetical protein
VIPVTDRRAISPAFVHLCERQIDRRKEACTHTFIVLYFHVRRVQEALDKSKQKYYITNCCTVVYEKYFCYLASPESLGLSAEGPPSDFAPPCKIGIQAPAVPAAYGGIKHPALRGCGVFFESNPNTVHPRGQSATGARAGGSAALAVIATKPVMNIVMRLNPPFIVSPPRYHSKSHVIDKKSLFALDRPARAESMPKPV